MANGKKVQPEGWGDDKKQDQPKKDEPFEALTEKEIIGLRAILDRHGYDRKEGKF